ncbi:MAG: 4-aminobutyrate--2-oxoglutarate transaminase [Deltaproteobacteria bacterium]|nr:4-aminobutyrate--2-oxoglutarate transaminase [Deltaproteobacteria bacterium]
MSKTEDLLKAREENVPRGPFNVTPYFAAGAKGATIRDVEGREFIDFAGGIGVMNVGHCAPRVVEAVKDQAEKFTHTCFHVVMYESYVELARKMNQITPGAFPKKTMFVNSGAEAVENAVKIARYATGRPGIVVFEDAFHGRTLLAMTLTSKVKPYKFGFGPYAPDVYRIPYAYCYRCAFGLEYPSCELRCADYLKEVFNTHISAENVAAVLAEPVLGEGGFVVPPAGWHRKVKEICEQNGILYIDDEVQTGFGRTARMFAIEHFGVEPDIITTAKSLGGGLPIAGVTGRAEIMEAPHVGGLGGTFGGNPLACRAGLAVIETFEAEDLLGRAETVGRKVMDRFKEMEETYELIGDVRGVGAMVAMELVRDRVTREPAKEETGQLVKKCYEKGLITISAGTHGNIMRALMPLVISDDELDRGLAILEESLGEIG